jgi:hypothetical protein
LRFRIWSEIGEVVLRDPPPTAYGLRLTSLARSAADFSRSRAASSNSSPDRFLQLAAEISVNQRDSGGSLVRDARALPQIVQFGAWSAWSPGGTVRNSWMPSMAESTRPRSQLTHRRQRRRHRGRASRTAGRLVELDRTPRRSCDGRRIRTAGCVNVPRTARTSPDARSTDIGGSIAPSTQASASGQLEGANRRGHRAIPASAGNIEPGRLVLTEPSGRPSISICNTPRSTHSWIRWRPSSPRQTRGHGMDVGPCWRIFERSSDMAEVPESTRWLGN